MTNFTVIVGNGTVKNKDERKVALPDKQGGAKVSNQRLKGAHTSARQECGGKQQRRSTNGMVLRRGVGWPDAFIMLAQQYQVNI